MAVYVTKDPATGTTKTVFNGGSQTLTPTPDSPVGQIGTKTPESAAAVGKSYDGPTGTRPGAAPVPGSTVTVPSRTRPDTGVPTRSFGLDPFSEERAESGPVAGVLPFEDEEEEPEKTYAPVSSLIPQPRPWQGTRPEVRPEGLIPLPPERPAYQSPYAPKTAIRPQARPPGTPEGFGIDPGAVDTVPMSGQGLEGALVGGNPILAAKEQQYGLPDAYLHVMWQIESSSGQNLVGDRSSAAGHFAFMPETAQEYGLEDPNDLEQSADAAARYAANSVKVLSPVLGRAPTGPELYLAHQQGAGGARALLQNPTAMAADVVGVDAVRLNGGDPATMTAQDFVGFWNDRYWEKAAEAAAVQGWSGSPQSEEPGHMVAELAPTPPLTMPPSHNPRTAVAQAPRPMTRPGSERSFPAHSPSLAALRYGLDPFAPGEDNAAPGASLGLDGGILAVRPPVRQGRYSFNPVTGLIEEV